MKLADAIESHKAYLKTFAKPTSQDAYNHLYYYIKKRFPEREIESLTAQESFDFLNEITKGRSQAMKRLRYQQIKSILNFAINNLDITMKNICTTPMLSTAFRAPKRSPRQLIGKEEMDTIIYRTDSLRDRLILELGARCCMRIGEILKLTPKNVIGTRLILENPKSGKDTETVIMPEKVAQRLQGYISEKKIPDEARIFRLSYSGARSIMNKIQKKFGVKLRLHDLRRFGATHASRAGVPLEIVSRNLLRHSDLKISQLYIGATSPDQTQRWLDTIYER
jgi:integrase